MSGKDTRSFGTRELASTNSLLKKSVMSKMEQTLFLELLDTHGPALVLYAQQWMPHSTIGPEDVVQEAFVKLMQQQPVPKNTVGWLYRVVRNQAISAARSTTRRIKHEKNAATQTSAWFTNEAGGFLDTSEAANALQNIPLELREVIVLRLWAGRSFEEIANLIEKSISTAHRRYESGLVELRKHLGVSSNVRKNQS